MILVDTSVWIDHLRAGAPDLSKALEDGAVLVHSFVIGELACGTIRNRVETLALLQDLPSCVEATHDEVMEFIESRKLMARGIGYVDAHLLAAAILTPDATLSTRDTRLSRIAKELGV